MYDVNWFTDGKHTFIEKCLVDNKNLDQLGDDNSTCTKENKHAIMDHITGHQNIGTMDLSIDTELEVYL